MINVKKALPNCIVKKGLLKSYTYKITCNDKIHHILVLPVNKYHIVTVNSKYIWNIKSGSVNGIQFKTNASHLLQLQEFMAYENPMISYKQPPYKTLKYLNESDVIDISNQDEVYGIPVFQSVEKMIEYFQQSEQF